MKLSNLLLRHRYVLLALGAIGGFLWQWLPHQSYISDYDVFAYGGQAMTGSIHGFHAGLHIYADDPVLQIGPLPLLVAGLLFRLPGNTGHVVWMLLVLAIGLATVRFLESIAKALGRSSHWAEVGALTGGAALMSVWVELAYYGHLEEALAIALIVLAVQTLIVPRPWWVPAILIGASAMCKPWGLVALPLLLQLSRQRRTRAVLLALATAGVLWAPFVIAAPHTVSAIGSLASYVMPHSALRGFGFAVNQGGPRSARAIELVFGLALGTLAALRGRWLAVPMIGLAARALLDPRWFVYYGAGLLAAAMLCDIAQKRRWPLWTLLVGVLELLVQVVAPPAVGAGAQMLLGLLIPGLVLGVSWSRGGRDFSPPRSEDQTPPLQIASASVA